MTRALIIGAGVAGPVTAMALRQAGMEAVVYEGRDAGADDQGSWLTLQANGIDALRAVDAHRRVAALGFPTTSICLLSGTGKVLGTMSNGAPQPDGTTSQIIRRAELYRCLRDEAVARGVVVEYGRRLVDASTTPTGVTATFADGSSAAGDVLIGCDGIRSRVRQLIDPEAKPARYVPVLNIGGYVPDLDVGAPADQLQMIFGRRCFFGYTATPDGGVMWFANPPRATEPAPGELAAMTDGQWRSWLLDLMAGDRGPAREIIAADAGPLRGWATYDMPRVRRWHSERMVIIGDAAHATAPSAGQGAALALEDAVLVARALRDSPDPATAFASFAAERRERVEKVVAHGARSSNAKAVGPVGRVIRDAMLPLVFRLLNRRGAAGTNWIQGHHIEWEAPGPALTSTAARA